MNTATRTAAAMRIRRVAVTRASVENLHAVCRPIPCLIKQFEVGWFDTDGVRA
jgi:hypothetical protein